MKLAAVGSNPIHKFTSIYLIFTLKGNPMSRSSKKNPFGQIVCMKPKTKSKIKRLGNRSYRRLTKNETIQANRGLKDFKKVIDNEYTYDLFTRRANVVDIEDGSEWFYKWCVRK